TNTPHGSFTAQLRHDAFNALNPGPPGGTRGPSVPHKYYNITAGGPLYIPKLYDGRNKTFLFISAERNPPSTVAYPITAYINAANVPTLAMREGDFSKYLAKVKPGLQLIDPLNGTPFSGNIIPRSRWNSAAINAIDKYYPD